MYFLVSILGLVDKRLRQSLSIIEIVEIDLVSILGLVDKRLRHNRLGFRHSLFFVSILGLVDKRLRPLFVIVLIGFRLCFNPWFSG